MAIWSGRNTLRDFAGFLVVNAAPHGSHETGDCIFGCGRQTASTGATARPASPRCTFDKTSHFHRPREMCYYLAN
jgi:hypothetical protein